MSQFATAAEMRDFMEWTGTAQRKSTTNLDLLLIAASDFLERRTGRVITSSASNTARTFTTEARPYLTIPDLRTASSVTLQGSTLVADASYWLIPSRQAADIYTGIQLQTFRRGDGRAWYLGNPEWFDRGLDLPLGPRDVGSLPNDLVITGLWGWTSVPSAWKLAALALAGYYYQHADALFAGARATPEGNIFDLSSLPSEVQALVSDWSLGEQVVAT